MTPWHDRSPIYRQLADRLTSNLLDGDPPEGDAMPSVRVLAQRLYREGEGNPLFIVEMIRGLVDQGVICEAEVGYRLDIDATDVGRATLPIPSSIREAGGAGSGVAELLAAEGISMPILHLGLPDAFQHHASREDLLAEAGLDAAGIRAAVLKRWPGLAGSFRPQAATA